MIDPAEKPDFIELVNLGERLKTQADNVEPDGHLNAARIMRHAADALEYKDTVIARQQAIIEQLNELLFNLRQDQNADENS